MQSDAALREALAAVLPLGLVDAHPGASADTVELRIGFADHERQSEKRQQLLVKRQAGLVVADREHHVGAPVNLHRVPPFLAAPAHDGLTRIPSLSCRRPFYAIGVAP